MTNEELLTDLKQFITATVSQEVGALRRELKDDIKELKADIKALDQKVDAIQDAIAETLMHATEPLDAKVKDLNRRVDRLELLLRRES